MKTNKIDLIEHLTYGTLQPVITGKRKGKSAYEPSGPSCIRPELISVFLA